MKPLITLIAVAMCASASAQTTGDPVNFFYLPPGVKDTKMTTTKVNSSVYGFNSSGVFTLIPQSTFQAALVSGTSIKTINSNTLLGSGDLVLVVDAINNGVTGTAPSQNAVFDALAMKSDAGHTHTINDVTGLQTTLDELASDISQETLDRTDSDNSINASISSIATSLSGKQPLDADLTAIAALSTNSYGRSLLTLTGPDALSASLDGAADPFVRTSDLGAGGITDVTGSYPVMSSGGATPDISIVSSIGGEFSSDAHKIAEFGPYGQLRVSSDDEDYALSATATAIGQLAVRIESTNADGVTAFAAEHAITGVSSSASSAVMELQNTDRGNVADLIHAWNSDAKGMEVKNDGGLSWTTATGARTTTNNIELFDAFNKGVVPASGGSATTYLDGSGAWSTPAGTGITNVTGTSPISSSGGTTPVISISNAAADGSTKGAASFTAADFNSTTGNISIDYTNGQAASGSVNGFLASADWTTFNNKQSAITFGTGVQTALGVNVGSAGSPVVNGGALGTPSSGTATNLTGTASGLTAGNVTTNANLTGPITSVGNATTIADAELSSIAGLTSAADKGIQFTGSGTAATYDLTTAGKALLDDASASVQRTTLGATTVGANLFTLTNPGAVTWNRVNADNTVTSRTASETRTDLSLVPGTDVQAYDAELAALAGLTSAADKIPYFTGSGTSSTADFTSTARTLSAASSIAAFKSLLGIVDDSGAPATSTSSNSYADVTGASFTLKANTTYWVDIRADVRSTNTGSAPNVSISCTNSPTISLHRITNSAAGTVGQRANITANDGGTDMTSVTDVNTFLLMLLQGVITTGGSDSVITLRFKRGGANNNVSIQSYGVHCVAEP